MPTNHERLSIVVDDNVAAALDRAAARRQRVTSRAGLARELLVVGERAESDEAADQSAAEARRRETAQAAIAWARAGFTGLDLEVLSSGQAWSRE
jgi:cellobiose phosphorylase